MILGFKTGPSNFEEGQAVVDSTGARMCEVWFNVTKADEYTNMFAWLAKHNVSVGLHHWGVINGNIKTNLATKDIHIRNETIAQIKRTIDIGQSIGCVYVNAHPGAQAIETINFTDWKQEIVPSSSTDKAESEKLFLDAAQDLTQYANYRNILLTIESITARESRINHDRNNIYDSGNISLQVLTAMGQQGGWFANDISHTGSHFLLSEKNTESAWKATIKFSKQLAPRTRLIHMNVITPPYNGTDSHDGITEADLVKETFPNKQRLIDFLRLFKGREDVYVVNEPKGDVTGNYQALQRLALSL